MMEKEKKEKEDKNKFYFLLINEFMITKQILYK